MKLPFYFILFFCYLLLFFFLSSEPLSISYCVFVLFTLLVCVVLEIKSNDSAKTMYLLLIFSLSVTNLIPIYQLISFDSISDLSYVVYSNHLNFSVGLVSIFIISLILGFSFFSKVVASYSGGGFRRYYDAFGEGLIIPVVLNEINALALMKRLFLILAIACALLFSGLAGESFWGASHYRLGLGEGRVYDNSLAGNFKFLFQIFYVLYIYCVMATASAKYLVRVNGGFLERGILSFVTVRDLFWGGLLFGYTLLYLIGGDRGPFLISVLTIFSAYTFVIKKLNFVYFVVAIVCGAAAMKLITFYRSGLDGGFEFVMSLFSEGEFLLLFNELYGTFKHIQVSREITLVDGYYLGELWFAYLVAPIPLLLRFLRNHGLVPDHTETATFFTDHILNGDIYTGLGTNLIADIYVNLGLLGVIFGGFLIGLILVYFGGLRARSSGFLGAAFFLVFCRYRVVAFLVLTSGFVYLPRASLLHELKAVLWAILILFLVRKTIMFFRAG